MNYRLLTLFAFIQINLSLTTTSNISGVDYSGQQPFTDTSFPLSSCPCPRTLTVSTLGYSPCSVYNYISPRDCDAYIRVALVQAFSDLLGRVDLPLFSNYCFAPISFEEDRVSSVVKI